jgi:hypothetical protein
MNPVLHPCSVENQSRLVSTSTHISHAPADNRAIQPTASIKRKVAFAMIMGVVTTGVISFTLISLNLGFTERFLRTWMKSWALGYVVVIPAILILSPMIQRAVEWLLGSQSMAAKREQ